MKKINLMEMALASLSGVSDIFTDAPECAASVAAIENLKVLAGKLAHVDTVVTTGQLHADGAFVAHADVFIDGAIRCEGFPADFDTEGRTWTLRLKSGLSVSVAMFEGESEDDEPSWVVDDAEAFYNAAMVEISL
jgi:hypothetical protein